MVFTGHKQENFWNDFANHVLQSSNDADNVVGHTVVQVRTCCMKVFLALPPSSVFTPTLHQPVRKG